jgi:hypothetical protein
MPGQLVGGRGIILTAAAAALVAQLVRIPPVEPVLFAQTVPGSEKKKDEEPKAPVQVRGKVVDRDGKGLLNADVTIAGPGVSETKKTGSAGVFVFEVTPGTYTITAKTGDKSVRVTVELSKDTELQSSLVLNTEK